MDGSKLTITLFTEDIPDYKRIGEQMAQWIYDEFIHNIRRGVSIGDVRKRFAGCTPGILPLRYAAFWEGARAGTVSLVNNDLKYRDYSPWLSSLYVEPAYRNYGIGRTLIETVKTAAFDMGFDKLYLRTEFAGGYYRKLGWTFVEQCMDEYGLSPEVFCWRKGEK